MQNALRTALVMLCTVLFIRTLPKREFFFTNVQINTWNINANVENKKK